MEFGLLLARSLIDFEAKIPAIPETMIFIDFKDYLHNHKLTMELYVWSDEPNNVPSFEAKNRVFKFDYQKMNMFEFVRCLKNDV